MCFKKTVALPRVNILLTTCAEGDSLFPQPFLVNSPVSSSSSPFQALDIRETSTTQYDVLPTLGDGSYGTVETDRLNIRPNESVLVQHPETTLSWGDLLNSQKSQHFLLAVSNLEFEKMAGPTSRTVMSFDGSLRARNNWFQLVINTTAGDRLVMQFGRLRTMYLRPQGHVTTGSSNGCRTSTTCWPTSRREVQHLPEGKQHDYVPTPGWPTIPDDIKGVEHSVIAEVHGDPTTVFNQYTWGNGFGWTYQQPLDIWALFDLPFDRALHHGRQSLEYLAQDGVAYFPSDLQVRINGYKAEQGLKTPARGHQDLIRWPGHPRHVGYINSSNEAEADDPQMTDAQEPPSIRRRRRLEWASVTTTRRSRT